MYVHMYATEAACQVQLHTAWYLPEATSCLPVDTLRRVCQLATTMFKVDQTDVSNDNRDVGSKE